MTQSSPKDKPRSDERPAAESEHRPEEESTRDLIESLAAAYFNTCRKIAKMLNRGGGNRR